MSTSCDESGVNNNLLTSDDVVQTLSDKIGALYLYRDHYFESHPITQASQKNSDVEDELKKVMKIFDDLKGSSTVANRAMFYYLKGRALNVTPNFNILAEEAFSKCLKLDPKLVEAWNELGECYWKKDDVEEARNCFAGALSQGKNKISLRNMSMVLRQQSVKTSEERLKNIEEGVQCAHEAVQLDPNDGQSWAILGNAYLSSYFNISQNPKVLKQCMSAYSQAEKDITARSSPELHYNKAIAYKYEEEYKLALESFSQAQALDPMWESPKQKANELLKYLSTVQELVNQKGKLKGKKYLQLLHSIDEKNLGPYSGGSYKSKNQEVLQLELISLKNMKEGFNIHKVILGKVVCSVQEEDAVPFTFCMVDKEETCIAVTLYNLAKGKGVIIGDSVAIPEPYLTHVHVKSEESDFSYKSVRVNTPLVMVVNGKKMGRDQQAGMQLSTFKKN